GVLEPGAQAAGVPVARAAEFGLEAARRDGDHAGLIIGDPVGFVVVVEFDRAGRGERERDVVAARRGVAAVVFVPTVVEGGFVLVAAGGQGPCGLPDIVAGVVGQVAGGAAGVPIAAATDLALERS